MSEDWNLYRTRFLVRAKQLTQGLTFTDALGRDHRGQTGDYVVQFTGGVTRIMPREIFEDIYVVLVEKGSPPARVEANRNFPAPQTLSA